MRTALSERSRAISEAVSEMPEQQFLVVKDSKVKDEYKESRMDRKSFLCVILVVIIIFFAVVYLFALDIDVILSELKRLNIKVTSPAKQIEVQLPTELSDANWGLKKIICEQGGYDLYAYAGKKVSLTCFPISERYHFIEPLKVWVVSSGDKIICVYKTVNENSNMVPGVFPVENPKVKEQFK